MKSLRLPLTKLTRYSEATDRGTVYSRLTGEGYKNVIEYITTLEQKLKLQHYWIKAKIEEPDVEPTELW